MKRAFRTALSATVVTAISVPLVTSATAAPLLSSGSSSIFSSSEAPRSSGGPGTTDPGDGGQNQQILTFEEIQAELDNHGPEAEMLMAAHRGQWREYPENSLMAVEEAIADGAEIIELDVMITQDNVPVLMHDATVDRTTDGTGRVDEMTYAEIRELNLVEGLGGEDAAVTEHKVPTLEEAMELVKNRVLVNIDKAGTDPRVIDVLETTETFDHAIFKSGNFDEAVEFLEEYPEGNYMLIISDSNYEQAFQFPGEKPFAYEVTFDQLDDAQAQPGYLDELSQQGRIWINTMWGSLAAGNTDETSLRDDTDLGWDTVIEDFGANMVQTDNVEAFDYWREGNPLSQWDRQPGADTVRVQAEDPVPGGQGVGFHDIDENNCASFSPEHDALDVCDQRGAKVLGYIRGSEWVEYTVDIETAGTYDVSARVSSPYDPAGTVEFSWDGEPGATFQVQNTTSHNAFERQHVETREFSSGEHTFRIFMPTGTNQNFNIDYFQFDRVG